MADHEEDYIKKKPLQGKQAALSYSQLSPCFKVYAHQAVLSLSAPAQAPAMFDVPSINTMTSLTLI